MKIVFMGTSDFAVPALESIHSSSHKILQVFTRPPAKANRGHKLHKSPIHEAAENLSLPLSFPTSLKTQEVIDQLKSLEADIIVVAAYGHILRTNILTMYKYGCLNIHPSLLPRWRGAAPIERTILSGDTETALCIMQMDEGLDTGDILLSKTIEISHGETSTSLMEKASKLGGKMIVEALDNYTNLKHTKQSEIGVTYATKLSKTESIINWQDTAETIERMVRGLNPWPGCIFSYNNEQIKILAAEYSNDHHNLTPGTIIDKQMTIACGQGTIKPTILQRQGKKALPIKDFLNGIKITPGTVLYNAEI